MPKIDHIPCVTDEQVVCRLLKDQLEIKQMVNEGHQVISMVSYQSPTTFECHCLPIFTNDKLEDIVNRYYDFFPKDFMQCIKETEEENANLKDGSGMSDLRTLMSYGKIPRGLQKMLDIWCGGDFLPSYNKVLMRRNLKRLFSYVPKLKIGRPYGQKVFKSA